MKNSNAVIGWTLLGVGAILLYEGAYKGNTSNPFAQLFSVLKSSKTTTVNTGHVNVKMN